MQQINLDLDKENELIFKISIEGTKPATAKSRFLLESPDYTLVFPASRLANGEVSVVVPTLEKVLEEGLYSGTLEVIVDDRVFEPIKLDAEFKKTLKVVAESVVRKRQETTVTATSAVVVNAKPSVTVEEKIVNESEVQPESEKEEKLEERAPAPRPPQRNRIKPKQRQRSDTQASPPNDSIKNSNSQKLIEQIAKKHGITLSEDQLKSVLRKYAVSKKIKTKDKK